MNGRETPRSGLSGRQARTLEYTIVAASILALVLIFQPFSLQLFTLGAAAIIIVGLLFNLVPFCQPGKSVGALVRVALIIVVIFIIVTALSLASAELYAAYIAPPPE
jgi:hypothetical protein